MDEIMYPQRWARGKTSDTKLVLDWLLISE